MFMVPAFFIGAVIGIWRVSKKQGNKLDMLQYGAAMALSFLSYPCLHPLPLIGPAGCKPYVSTTLRKSERCEDTR